MEGSTTVPGDGTEDSVGTHSTPSRYAAVLGDLVLTVRCFLTLYLCFCLGAVELLATLPLLHHTSSCCCFVLSHHVFVTKSSPGPTRAALLHSLFSLVTVVGIQAELCLLERSHLCPAAEFCH